jgi:hypothetical protein
VRMMMLMTMLMMNELVVGRPVMVMAELVTMVEPRTTTRADAVVVARVVQV